MPIIECENCHKLVERTIADIRRKGKIYKHLFCSLECFHLYQIKEPFKTKCLWCNKDIEIKQHELKKSKTGRHFCCKSHSASYNNSIRKRTIRSKIEIQFYNLLVKEFPDLAILPNDKTMLEGLEADIAIPELKLAIEWNGIVHFKPIYGQTKLNKVKNTDNKKILLAQQKNINLIVIPDLVSNKKILNQAFKDIKNIIMNLLNNNEII